MRLKALAARRVPRTETPLPKRAVDLTEREDVRVQGLCMDWMEADAATRTEAVLSDPAMADDPLTVRHEPVATGPETDSKNPHRTESATDRPLAAMTAE